jgi:hypothetical protein
MFVGKPQNYRTSHKPFHTISIPVSRVLLSSSRGPGESGLILRPIHRKNLNKQKLDAEDHVLLRFKIRTWVSQLCCRAPEVLHFLFCLRAARKKQNYHRGPSWQPPFLLLIEQSWRASVLPLNNLRQLPSYLALSSLGGDFSIEKHLLNMLVGGVICARLRRSWAVFIPLPSSRE